MVLQRPTLYCVRITFQLIIVTQEIVKVIIITLIIFCVTTFFTKYFGRVEYQTKKMCPIITSNYSGPVSRDYIAGSGSNLIEVEYFLKSTSDQFLVYRLDCALKSPYFYEVGGRSTRKGKISAQINPWRVVDFSSDIFLV